MTPQRARTTEAPAKTDRAARAPIRQRGLRRSRRIARLQRLERLFAGLTFAAGALSLLALPAAHAQFAAPLFVDDSAAATDGLSRAEYFASTGSLDESIHVLQALLEAEGDRVVPSRADADLFGSVRSRIHEMLLANEPLLARYREKEGAVALRLLEEGADAQVERSRLLTSAGFEAALRIAQRRLEAAQFESAWRSLEQLEKHPDRRGAAARDAAALLSLVAAYVNRPAVWSVAERWGAEAGLPAGAGAPQEPVIPPHVSIGLSPLAPTPPIDLSEMVSRPLWSEPLSLEPVSPRQAPERRVLARSDNPPPGDILFVVPTVSDDLIFVNDSESISAWDRFTLALRWRAQFESLPAARRQQATQSRQTRIEDLSAVSVYGPWVVAATGLPVQSQREGDARVHALDARTGRHRWSVLLSELDPSLEDATVRGPALIDQGVVVLTTVKYNKVRRLDSVHMVGLDLADGSLVWRRHLGSTGAFPYNAGARIAESAAIADGVAYLGSRLGFAAALESATGRVLWVRRLEADGGLGASLNAWEIAAPQIIGSRVYMVSPDQASVIALERTTGAVAARRSASSLNRARYLLARDESLVAVSERTVQVLNASSLGDLSVEPRTIIESPAIRGRVTLAGGEAVAPVQEGLLTAPLAAAGPQEARLTSLDYSGNVLTVESQLVVVDDDAVHTYLIWGVAERMLRERMDTVTDDATPAATYAELAHRAGRPEKILPAVDRALSVIETHPLDVRNQDARRRLFAAVLAMVDPDPAGVPGPQPDRRTSGELIDRLSRLAASPQDRVRQLLALAQHSEAGDQPAPAVEAYQRILTDTALAGATVSRHGATFDAEVEAASRLRRVVRAFGRAPYARFDAEAERALAAAKGAMDPAPFAAVARRYPVARAAPKAWLEAATVFASSGRPHGSIYALERGLSAAEDALAFDDPLVGELGGRLVQALIRNGRPAAANATLARLLERSPGLLLTEQGSPVDLASLRRMLTDRIADIERRPIVGLLAKRPATHVLEGWMLSEPVIGESTPASATYVGLRSVNQGLFGLFTRRGAGVPTPLWTAPADSSTALVQIDDAVYLARGGPEGVTIEKRELTTGDRVWTTPGFQSLFEHGAPPPPAARERGGRMEFVDTPLLPRRDRGELVVCIDARTIALVERSGRAAAFDIVTGRTLWSMESTVPIVYDAAAGGGMIVIAGGPDQDRPVEGVGPGSLLLPIDLRTGKPQPALPTGAAQVRWVRMTPEGHVLAGLDGGLASFDVFQGRARWWLTTPPGQETVDAWVFPGRVLVLSEENLLWQVETEDGAARTTPLDLGERIIVPTLGVVVRSLNDNAAMMCSQGVMLFDRRGGLIGMDHGGGERSILPGVFTRDYAIVIDRTDMAMDGDRTLFDLRFLSNTTAAALQRAPAPLGSLPAALSAVDGWILVTAGDATVIIDAPAPDPTADPAAPAPERPEILRPDEPAPDQPAAGSPAPRG